MTEKARRLLRRANRDGLFYHYRKVTQTERYADRLKFRALTKHAAWIKRMVYDA